MTNKVSTKELPAGFYWYIAVGKAPVICEKRIEEDFVRFTNGGYHALVNSDDRFEGPLPYPTGDGKVGVVRVTGETIGRFIDSVAGKVRTQATVAGRLIEEATELGLAAGLNAGQILAHVADALHNQALKDSARRGGTVFPTEIQAPATELQEECADVGLMLKDLCHVAGFDLDAVEAAKHAEFVSKTFRVSAGGTLYAVKPHITARKGD